MQTDRSVQSGSRAAFWLLVSMSVVFLAASSVPTPLYARYRAEWGFSPVTLTVVFGIYAIAVLLSLLTFGRLSDHIGRRPVLLGATAVQIVALLVFADAGGLTDLFVGRIVQGLATGAALGAIGAGLLDLDREKGTVANGIAPLTGTGTGALLSGVLVQFAPQPARLGYLVIVALLVLQGIGVVLMRETAQPREGALGSLRPRLAVPQRARTPLLLAVPVLIAVWGLGGFYASVGPVLADQLAGTRSTTLGGAALFVLGVGAAVGVWLTRRVAAATLLLSGAVGLVAGIGVTVLGVQVGSVVLFFAGTAVAGLAFGAGFQGSLRTVMPEAEEHERAGLLSVVYVVSYLGLGVPAVGGGVLVQHVGLTEGATIYGLVEIGLALLAVAGLLVRRVRVAREVRTVEAVVLLEQRARELASVR